jgi:hypothetical protein
MEHRADGGRQGVVKHAFLVIFSLFPFGISVIAALAGWEISGGFDPLPRLAFAVFSWVIAFAAGTQAFWKVVERLAPR